MNQDFTCKQLMKLCKNFEWEKYNIKKSEIEEQIAENYELILQDKFSFKLKRNGEYFSVETLPEKLIMRKLNDNIKRIYKDEQANRRIIIKQVIILLRENCPMWILKSDIKGFYESIDVNKLIAKFKNDFILSYHSISLIDNLTNQCQALNVAGLPRGLNISATLSEIAMRKFDRSIRSIKSIYYYARFVDDMIFFGNNKNELNKLHQSLNSYLYDGMQCNPEKTINFNGDNILEHKPLEYLGYKFFSRKHGNKKELVVTIADKKISKIKSRIVQSFLQYFKDKDFNLLQSRIKFLTGNYCVKKSEEGTNLKAGIYYNYPMISEYRVLIDLNIFLKKTIYAKKGSFGYKISNNLSLTQKLCLSKYSFQYGFENKVYYNFKPSYLRKIRECW